MPELVLDRDSELFRVLDAAATHRRCVFVAGLPGVGKSLIVQQLALLADRRGRSVHLLQWDVARLPFDRPDILARYPESDGVTHATIRSAVGMWARGAVRDWDRANRDQGSILIGETPLIGNRLSSLARPMDDDVEDLLSSEATVFIIPAPSRAVREVVESARARDSSDPRHARDTKSAAPHLVSSGWTELARVGSILGIGTQANGYDERVYAETYRRVLARRNAIVLPIVVTLDTRVSAHEAPRGAREIVPATSDVDRLIAAAAARAPADIEREAEHWYESEETTMAMTKENRHLISGKEAMRDGKPAYSSAVVAGDTIYLAGAVAGRDANGNVIGRGDIAAQATAVFENLKDTLASAGASFADLVKITVYVTKLEYRATIGEVRSRYVPQPPPASTFIVVQSLADPDFLVEIEGIAVRPTT